MKRLLLFLLFFAPSVFAAGDRVSLVFQDVRLADLLRVTYTEIARQPYVLGFEVLQARELYSVDLRDVDSAKAINAVRSLAVSSGYRVLLRDGVVWIDKVSEVEDQELVVYKPRFRSSQYLADVVQGITGARSVLARSLRNPEPSSPVQNVNSPPVSSPSSVYGQIDRSEVDQIAFSVPARDAIKVQNLLADLDTPAGEVFLKVAVYEVGLNETHGSAVKLAASIIGGRLGVSIAGNVIDGASISIKQGGIEAVISALDADSRFKSISRPRVRVRNGAQATFNVGQDVPVLGVAQIDRNGNPVQSVEYKQSGIILTASPQIRQDVIEVDLRQELSNFVVTKTGVNNSPTLIKRSVNTKLGLQPGEVVVLAGLQDDQQNTSENRLPFVDWLLGRSGQSQQSEILIFIEAQRI